MKLLQSQPGVQADKSPPSAYCFHGIKNPAQLGKVKAKILVMNGDAGPFTEPKQIAAFKKEIKAAGADFEFIGYPSAKYSFTNPQADCYG